MRAIIKRDRVDLVGGRGPEGRPRGSASRECAPERSVRLIRADGRVRAIELTCSCGEVTVLEVEYEAAPAGAHQEAP